MPTFLSDPSTSFYLILGIGVFIAAILFVKNRDKQSILQLVGISVLFVGLFLLDFGFESPREACIRAMKEMAEFSKNQSPDQILSHVSESFQYKSMDKNRLREMLKRSELQSIGYQGFEVWNFMRNQFTPIDETTVEIGFNAQLRGMPQTQKSVFATFKKDPDANWRLSGFAIYPLGQGKQGQEESIPNW